MSEKIEDDALTAKMKKVATRVLSAPELQRQRVSYVMGAMGRDSTMSKAEVERLLMEKA